MKYLIRIMTITSLFSLTQLGFSDSITDVYATGDTLTVNTLNNIKSAVNDNDSRIGANATSIGSNTSAIGANTTAIGGKQDRVAGACPAGQSINAINADGTVSCEVDDDTNTTYSAGTGLNLSGTTFSADTTSVQSRVTGTCPTGQSIRVINANGTVTCEVDSDTNTTYTAGSGLTLSGTQFSVTAAPSRDMVVGKMHFNPWFGGPHTCHINPRGLQYFALLTSSITSNCGIFAPVDLPHGATVTRLSCDLFDNFAPISLSFDLFRAAKDGTTAGLNVDTPATVNSTADQTRTSPLRSILIDREQFDYFLFSNHTGATTAGSDLRVYSCTLTLTGP